MALSQLQCLDDNHVNPRTHESKPEFLYCEDQRLALEALLQDGREAFFKYLEARGLRGFLSDLELETLAGAVEPYDPDSEIFPENAEEDEPPLSLHYWPELSDTSIPQMDLGWPDSDAYRGVTRTTMYSQPPLDGQAHIKEIVRKMIAQAQKVVAVVMDVFTDVDIFRDLLEAGFKRRVSVYILLDHTALPHFLSMCQRANMHAGHLKHLRVRCTGGAEFYTRSSTKVRGRMGHRFMFIDGDKAVSGSYSFTWMSSRLDGNHITVVTGQAVDAFDRLFRILYVTSSSVDLRQVTTEPEPEPEPLPQIAPMAPPSAAVARKLYNPKYALALGNPSPSSSPTPSAGHNNPRKTESLENSRNPEVLDTKKRRRRKVSKEDIQEAPPIHPGLTNLEKACMISYLPTWPEPDPPSDVIGFINIRDASKQNQVHLQRSEMFGTSQAIRFSSPFSMPEETLPEVAKPRQLTAKYEEINNFRPTKDKNKADDSMVDRCQPTQLDARPGDIKIKAEVPEQNTPTSGPTGDSDKGTAKTFNTEDKPYSNTPTNTTPHLNEHAPPQSSSKASTPNTGRPSHATQAVITNDPQPDSLPRYNAEREADTSALVYRPRCLQLNSTQTSHLRGPPDSNTGQLTQTKMVPPHTDSHTQAVHPQNSSEITPNIQTPAANSVSPSSPSAACFQSVTSTSFSENNHISNTTSMTTSTSATLSSISSSSFLPPLTSSSTTLILPLPSSSASSSSTSSPPISKPRTVQLVIKDCVPSYVQKLPEFSVIRTSTGLPVVHNESAVETVMQTSPEKEPESLLERQNNSESKTGVEKDAENTGNIEVASQQREIGTLQETKNEEEVGLCDDRTGMHLVAGAKLEAQSDILNTDAPKAKIVNIKEIIQKDVEPKTLTSIDRELTPQKVSVAKGQAGTKAPERALTGCEFTQEPNENSKNVKQHKSYCTSAHELQRITSALTPKDIGVLDIVDSVEAPTHTPVAATHNPHMSKDSAGDSSHTSAADTHVQQGIPGLKPAPCPDGLPNNAKHNTQNTFQELNPKVQGNIQTPKKSLCLLQSNMHMPDLCSPTPERESRSHTALVRTPTPDGFLPHTPSPDLQMPDPQSHSPDFRTPTPDVSDGYVSPRADSARSTTSEEYYECSSSPLNESVFDRAACRNNGMKEDCVTLTQNTPIVKTTATSPACINNTIRVATLETTDRKTSSSETQSLSGPACVSSLSALPEKKVKMGEEQKTANEEEKDEKGRKLSVAERRSEGDSKETQKRGREEAKRTVDYFKQGKDLARTVEKNKEAQPQLLKRKRVLNQSAAEKLVEGGVTPGELTNEGAEPKRWSTGDLKPKKVSSEGERTEKAVARAALGPSGVERRDRETEGQKLLHTPPRPPQGQQQDSVVSTPSRPSRSPRPHSANQPLGSRPCGSRQLNQAESKALYSTFKVMDNTSSPRRPPSRPPPPVAAGAIGFTAGQKQAEVSHSQQNLLTHQSQAVQGRERAGQSPIRHTKHQAPFPQTHSNSVSQLHSRSQNQTASAREAQSQEEGRNPFSFTISRLYSLKGLKDKMSKLPAQSKRGSTSSPVQGHKSTS